MTPKPVPAACEGGVRTRCPRRPRWKTREKGDHAERNWVFACHDHLHTVCADYGERAEIDVARVGI